MKNTLPVQVRAQIDRALKPVIEDFQHAVYQMRAAGATDDEIEQMVEAAMCNVAGPLDPNATAYALQKMREAVGLPAGNDN